MTNLPTILAPLLTALQALIRIAAALGSGRAKALLALHASLTQAMQQLQDLFASWQAGTLATPAPAPAPSIRAHAPVKSRPATARRATRRRPAPRRTPRPTTTRPQTHPHPTRALLLRATSPSAYARPSPPH